MHDIFLLKSCPDAQVNVSTASASGHRGVEGANGIPLRCEQVTSSVKGEKFDAVILPGGTEAAITFSKVSLTVFFDVDGANKQFPHFNHSWNSWPVMDSREALY